MLLLRHRTFPEDTNSRVRVPVAQSETTLVCNPGLRVRIQARQHFFPTFDTCQYGNVRPSLSNGLRQCEKSSQSIGKHVV